jgi:CheY-like chemotaxis protein
MPGMNGLQLVAAVREDGFDMPCVLATGWGVELSPADTEAAGVQAVLAKPYSAVQLRAVLAQVAGEATPA